MPLPSFDSQAILFALLNRRSVMPQAYTGETIPDEAVWKMLEAAHQAPTHKLTQPWFFRVCKEQKRDAFFNFVMEGLRSESGAETKIRKMEMFRSRVSHVVLVTVRLHPDAGIPEIEEWAAASAAVQNLHLAACALGYAGYWSTGMGLFSERMATYWRLESQEKPLGIFLLGVPDPDVEWPRTRRAPLDQHVQWIM